MSLLLSPALLLLNLAPAGTALASTIVQPPSFETTQGGSDYLLPFDDGDPLLGGIAPTAHLQQVFNNFNGLSDLGPVYITDIAFREPVDDNKRAFSATLPNVLLKMSSTDASSGNMAHSFSANLGPDVTTVYSGALSISSTASTLPNGTAPFDVTIHFQTPFFYDPSLGNLLLDMQNLSSTITAPLDMEMGFGNGIGSISDLGGPGGDFGQGGGLGLVTQFTYSTSAPEPSMLAAGAMMCAFTMARCRARRK